MRALSGSHGHRRLDHRGSTLLGLLILVMVFTAITLVALVDNTVSSSKINTAQNLSARDLRAADNALEAAVNDLRMDPDGEAGTVDACPGPKDFDSNNRTVTVSATCTESTRSMPADTGASAEAPSVKLVGADGYRAANLSGTVFDETVRWKNDCARGDTSAPSCAPWSVGIGLPNFTAHGASLNGAIPGLVHTSALSASGGAQNKSLGFASDVFVKKGAAVMIDPAAATPAVRVAGHYEQGDGGMFSAEGGVACGISGGSHPWNVLAARITDVDEEAGEPSCGSDGAAASAISDRLELGDLPEIPSADAATPTCPSPGGVAVLRPGRYDKSDTAQLNSFLGGNCSGRTFWFQPQSATQAGVYWFDVDNPTNPNGSAKPRDLWNSLIISDPTVRVIFGTPTPGYSTSAAQTAVFPQACNPAAYGVEIVLSPRTTIRHLDGKVAICDRDANTSTNEAPAALWQAGVADGGWRGLPDPATSTTSTSFRADGEFCFLFWCWDLAHGSGGFVAGTADKAWAMDGQLANAHFTCTATFGGACISDVTFSARGLGSLSSEAPSPGPVSSLDVVVKGSSWNRDRFWAFYNDGKIGTEIRFFSPGSTTPACGAYFPYAPDKMGANKMLTLSYDLLSSQAEAITGIPRCGTIGLDRASLKGSRVDLKLSALREIPAFNTVEVGYDIDGIELRAGWDLSPATATAGTNWYDANNLLPDASGAVSDGNHGGVTATCTPKGVFDGGNNCPNVSASVTLSAMDNRRNPYVPTSGSLQAAGVVITGNTSTQTWFTGNGLYDLTGTPSVDDYSNIKATLGDLRGATGSCTAEWPKVPFWGQGLYLDLLDPAVSGSCSSVLTNAEQLIGSTMTVTVNLQRNDRSVTCGGWLGECPSYSVRIDSVKLSTVTSGGYTRPRAPMLMTIGKASASGPSSFNVFGQVSMPRNDLTVRWDGQAPVVNDGSDRDGEPVPIGGGNMVLAGLGSFVGPDGEAGVICCSPTKPAERIVHLEARLDGRLAATADIRINDIGGPGSGLVIDDWSLKPAAG